jgi:4-aminobutyrate aminotransferase
VSDLLGDATAAALGREARWMSPSTRLPFPPVLVERGEGTRFWDAEGREYLDFHSMACILNTGHNHPAVVEAICDQARRLVHNNSAYAMHDTALRLAERLAGLAPGTDPRRVAFGLSGSDANDGAIKLARAATGRHRVIACLRSYHGNTYGALSLSAVSLSMRRGFGPELPGIHHVPFPDPYRMPGTPDEVAERCLAELRELLATVAPADEVAAIVVEPVQGDAGTVIPPAAWLAGVAELCAEHGILLVAEEVQTGVGRTGRWFASEHFGLEPDVLVVGKALGSGMPVSALVARSELMDSWESPGHVFCTAANPVCCAAALATLDVVEGEDLLGNADAMGVRLRAGLERLAEEHEAVGDVRGLGLMVGADMVADRETRERSREVAAAVVAGCLRRGLYMTFISGSVLRLAPPLTIGAADVDRALEILEEALRDATLGRVAQEDIAAVVGW